MKSGAALVRLDRFHAAWTTILLGLALVVSACSTPAMSPTPASTLTATAMPIATPTYVLTAVPTSTPEPPSPATATSTFAPSPSPTAAPTATPARPPSLCPQGCATPPPGCTIKGNISASGEKIFHVPGQKYYLDTVISPEKGERWFCTEDEARANGWRKSLV